MVMKNSIRQLGAARWLLLGGIAYPVLLAVAGVAFPAAPGGDMTGAAHPAWLLAHHDSVQLQCYVRALGAAAGLVFLGGLVATARQAGAGAGLATVMTAQGTAAMVGVLAAQAAGTAVAMAGAAGAGPQALQALDALNDGFLNLNGVSESLYYGAVAVAVLSARMGPRWLGAAGLIVAGIGLAGGLGAPGNPLEAFSMLSLLVFLVWNVVCAVTLLVRTRPARGAGLERAAA